MARLILSALSIYFQLKCAYEHIQKNDQACKQIDRALSEIYLLPRVQFRDQTEKKMNFGSTPLDSKGAKVNVCIIFQGLEYSANIHFGSARVRKQ